MSKIRWFAVIFIFVSQCAWGMNINPTHTGSWYNTEQNGHGLSVEVLDSSTTLIYWYVYKTDGTPQFLITVGNNNGNTSTGTTYYQDGMRFGEFDPNDLNQEVWGESTFTVNDCSSATLKYSANDPAYGSGTIPMIRLTSVQGVKCRNNPVQNTYHMTLTDGIEAAFGILFIFENGYLSFLAVSEHGGVTGIGQANLKSSDRVEFEFTSFDLFGGGWKDEFASGEYSEGYISANFEGGSLVATSISQFQGDLNYSVTEDIYDIFDLVTNSVIGTLTLDQAGNVRGNTFSGCSITGWYVIPDQQFNQIYTEMALTGCAMNPDMRGAGSMNEDGYIGLAMIDYYDGMIWQLRK